MLASLFLYLRSGWVQPLSQRCFTCKDPRSYSEGKKKAHLDSKSIFSLEEMPKFSKKSQSRHQGTHLGNTLHMKRETFLNKLSLSGPMSLSSGMQTTTLKFCNEIFCRLRVQGEWIFLHQVIRGSTCQVYEYRAFCYSFYVANITKDHGRNIAPVSQSTITIKGYFSTEKLEICLILLFAKCTLASILDISYQNSQNFNEYNTYSISKMISQRQRLILFAGSQKSSRMEKEEGRRGGAIRHMSANLITQCEFIQLLYFAPCPYSIETISRVALFSLFRVIFYIYY